MRNENTVSADSCPPSAVSPTRGIPASPQSLTGTFGSVTHSSRAPIHCCDETTARTPAAKSGLLATAAPTNR